MSILKATHLSKAFGADDIFTDLDIDLPHGAKVALVGPNGAGKSTLIRILIGLDTPSSGAVTRARGLSMGYLPQRAEFDSNRTIWEEMLTAFVEIRQQEAQLVDLAHEMAERPDDADLLSRYGEVQHAFDLAGGYDYETRIRHVLQGLGFTAEHYERTLQTLSGGQQTRALLARLLLEKPSLLILDEPTNHLDIAAVEWLESFLNSWEGALLVVSHDRYFMDRVVTTIWELDWGVVESYKGNYSAYLRQREERWQQRMETFEVERARLLGELDYIKKNIVRASTNAQAYGRLRRLSRDLVAIQQMGVVDYKAAKSWSQTGIGGVRTFTVAEAETAIKAFKPASVRPQSSSLRLTMKSTLRSGDKVLMTRGLRVGYSAEKALFTVPDLTLYRGETAAIIGPNGVGKSTFLKTLLGELRPLAGESKRGAQVTMGYFAQAHERLNPKRSILDELLTVRNLPISEARDYLANFLFTGEDVFRPIETLSGGERGRVALAKLALEGANLLLLDETTNHLDIPAQEVLQAMLDRFEGTILLVSHDRYLIDALATQIWAVEPGMFTPFDGTYQEYVALREARREAEKAARMGKGISATNGAQGNHGTQGKGKELSPREREKRIAAAEAQITQLETEIAQLTAELEA
ncbi:MAG TPA: ABC-F family ATP-binding cassette domain-containing protein, partial [Aggregatilineales bacterium]|nr:ABC-F family ATP-binding cassette domain-containing protein [Aggregatilineales bacterium]